MFLEVHSKVYDKEKFNFQERLSYLFKNGFSVKYLITDTYCPKELSELGYTAVRHSREVDYRRSLYKYVQPDHASSLVRKGIVRSLMLEKVSS